MKTFKYFFYTLFITLSSFLYGCNQEDDIYEIFDSGVWQLVNYYTGGDWESNNDRYARPAYTEAQDLESLSKITITFKNDGTFTGTLDGGTFEGKWQADPSDRSFAVIGEIKASIKLSGKMQNLSKSWNWQVIIKEIAKDFFSLPLMPVQPICNLPTNNTLL